MNSNKISMQDKLIRLAKPRISSRKESVESTRVPNTECNNTKEFTFSNIVPLSFRTEEKDSCIYDTFNTLDTSTTAFTPPPDLRFKIQPKEVLLDTENAFLTTSFESVPVRRQKRKISEGGVYKVWNKTPLEKHSDISDTFIDHYRKTYKNNWIGLNQGVKEIVPMRLHTSAIADHRWTRLVSQGRAHASHFQANPHRQAFSEINDTELTKILDNLLDTEKELTNPRFSLENLRRLKATFRKSAEQHKENISSKKAVPIIHIESSPTKSRDLERVCIPSSRIEI
jgi:hypothetical protein